MFRSIQQNVGESSGDSGRFLGIMLATAGGIVLLAVAISYGKKSGPRAKSVNHQGRLLKEIAKAAHLKPKEVKRLKALSEDVGRRRGEALVSPLVVLLCPSLVKAEGDEGR